MSRRLPRRLSTIRNRLAALFFVITAAAIAVVYFYVAPSLESSLREQKVANLASSARRALPLLAQTVGSNVNRVGVLDAVRRVADRTSAHVTLLGISSGSAGVVSYVIADSGVGGAPQAGRMELGAAAARSGRMTSGATSGSDGRSGVVALPIFFGGRVARVAVLAAPLDDVLANVALIRRRILISGLLALVLAVLAGTFVARALSQRVKRLEEAARRVAAGDFSARFRVDSDDELGQLAGALNDMQRQLAELDSARKRFIATASHELRTPIFSLGGFLELIQDEELDEETRRQFVGQVRAQVDRLGTLAMGLLDLSRLESGSVEMRPAMTDVAALARTVTAEFIPALNQHASHLELRVPRGPVLARCDPERVAQILRILVDNAVTHTPPGTKIVVTAARDEPAHEVSLSVIDEGEGVAQDALERIFDPFFTSDGVKGSGLGLAIARELAERMRAHLTLESQPQRTAFKLTLAA